MNGDSSEIINDGDAQMHLANVEGDLSDAVDSIEEVDYIEAIESLDDAIEKLNMVRRYLEGKSTK